MKIQLQLSSDKIEKVQSELLSLGVEIDPDAELVLSERNEYADMLYGKSGDGFSVVPTDNILYIESYGHDILIHTGEETFGCGQPLCKLQSLLCPDAFMRISNSVIVARSSIKNIGVSFQRKFSLTLKNGSRVDVTRSYYYKFKEWMGF